MDLREIFATKTLTWVCVPRKCFLRLASYHLNFYNATDIGQHSLRFYECKVI